MLARTAGYRWRSASARGWASLARADSDCTLHLDEDDVGRGVAIVGPDVGLAVGPHNIPFRELTLQCISVRERNGTFER